MENKIQELLDSSVFRMLKIIHYYRMAKYEMEAIDKTKVNKQVLMKAREILNASHAFKLMLDREPQFRELFGEIDQEKIFAMMTVNANMINMELDEILKLESMFEII